MAGYPYPITDAQSFALDLIIRLTQESQAEPDSTPVYSEAEGFHDCFVSLQSGFDVVEEDEDDYPEYAKGYNVAFDLITDEDLYGDLPPLMEALRALLRYRI